MNKAVYIGGFGNGVSSAERVAGAIMSTGYNEVEAFTFSQAMDASSQVQKAAKGVDVFTHSAGMLAVVGSSPESITAFNAPLPASIKYLVGKTLVKTAHMHVPGRGITRPKDIVRVARYEASALGELGRHPLGNLGKLSAISHFNAVAAAFDAKQWGIPTELVYTYKDDYYPGPGASDAHTTLLAAIDAHVGYTFLPGEHDELVLRPGQTLQNFFIATSIKG